MDLYFELSPIVFFAYTIGILCSLYAVIVYFLTIRKYLNDIEIGLNLDIWGVLIQAVDDVDILRRFVKRAPNTIHQTKDDGTTTFMEAAKLAKLDVFLCLVHGDVYKYELEDGVSAIERYQLNIDKKRALMAKFRGNSRLQIHNYKWKTPNGYIRNNEGKTVLWYLMKQYANDCKHIDEEDKYINLWKHNKIFKQRREWLSAFLKHVSQHPPTHRMSYRDRIEYKRTAFQLEYMDEDEWQQWILNIKSQQKSRTLTEMFDKMKRSKSDKEAIQRLETERSMLANHQMLNSASLDMDEVEIVAIKKHRPQVSETSSIQFGLSAFTEDENEKIFINMSDEQGENALHWATELKITDFLNLLLKLGANPNIVSKDQRFRGETPMVTAVRLERYEILDAFICWNNENPDSIQCDWYIPDNNGNDVIFACIEYEKPELLNDLLLADIDVTRLNPDNNTILQFAMLSKKTKLFKMILEKNMISGDVQNLLNHNNQDNSALEMAVLPKNKQFIEPLIVHFMKKIKADGQKETLEKRLLWTEIIFCFKKCIDLINANALKVFFQKAKSTILSGDDPECHKILQKIIIRGNVKLLEICCRHFGECLKLKNKNDETILFYCIKFNRPTLLRLLVNKYKCSINVKNKDGMALIEYCDRFDRPNCKQFIQRHVDRMTSLQKYYADDKYID